MKKKFTIFVVCATVVQNSLAILSLTGLRNMSTFSHYEQTVNVNFPIYKNDEPKVLSGILTENTAVNCESRVACEIAMSGALNGITAIFLTIENGLPKIVRKNEDTPIDDVHKTESTKNETNAADITAHAIMNANIETGHTETYAAYLAVLEAAFSALPAMDLAIQVAAVLMLQQAVKGVYMAINSTQGSDYSKCLIELQAIEDKATHDFRDMVVDIYGGIRLGRDYDAETEAKIDSAEEMTISTSNDIVENIFKGIEILLAAKFSGNQSENEDRLPPIRDAYEKARSGVITFVVDVFELIDMTCSTIAEGKLNFQ